MSEGNEGVGLNPGKQPVSLEAQSNALEENILGFREASLESLLVLSFSWE